MSYLDTVQQNRKRSLEALGKMMQSLGIPLEYIESVRNPMAARIGPWTAFDIPTLTNCNTTFLALAFALVTRYQGLDNFQNIQYFFHNNQSSPIIRDVLRAKFPVDSMNQQQYMLHVQTLARYCFLTVPDGRTINF